MDDPEEFEFEFEFEAAAPPEDPDPPLPLFFPPLFDLLPPRLEVTADTSAVDPAAAEALERVETTVVDAELDDQTESALSKTWL